MMGSDPRPIESGTRGTVDHVDDLGTIHCTFDNGRRLGIIPEEDSFRTLTQDEILDEQSEKLQMEYIDKVKEHTNESPLEVTVGNKLYQIYYAAANAAGDTEVPVPSNKTYTVSGNNVDGFIVTVSMN